MRHSRHLILFQGNLVNIRSRSTEDGKLNMGAFRFWWELTHPRLPWSIFSTGDGGWNFRSAPVPGGCATEGLLLRYSRHYRHMLFRFKAISALTAIEPLTDLALVVPIGLLLLQRNLDVRFADDTITPRFGSFYIIRRWAVSCMKSYINASFVSSGRTSPLVSAPLVFTNASSSLHMSFNFTVQSAGSSAEFHRRYRCLRSNSSRTTSFITPS